MHIEIGRPGIARALGEVVAGRASTRLAPVSRRAMIRTLRRVRDAVRRGDRVYGVSTGLGGLADRAIPREKLSELQRNLLRSHACGVGEPLPADEIRLLLVLKAHSLAMGHSGVRPLVAERLLRWYRSGILPRIPEQGSVGASGDLAPLAHLGLALTGEGTFLDSRGTRVSRRLGWLALEPKEGLAIVNGTQASSAVAWAALLRAEALLDLADLAGACSLDGLLGTPEAFSPAAMSVTRHPGVRRAAERLRTFLRRSRIRASHRDCQRVQDAYSLRCMPQVHGAVRDALAYVRRTLSDVADSVSDNPILFPSRREPSMAGHFHGQPIALACDHLASAIVPLATIAERRIERLVNPDLSRLPAFLTRQGGLNSGFMLAHVTAASLASECKALATPRGVDSIPTSAGQEDHVSMSMAAAVRLRRSLSNLEGVLAIELLCGCQALEFHRPLRSGPAVEGLYRAIRERTPALGKDRNLSRDIERVSRQIRLGEFLTLTRA
ncbi:MAG: histidine ammonia-lyase [Planctomycetes bacterium]|nr:histidine ammonia-lyase [Planctomycetota bacterium]